MDVVLNPNVRIFPRHEGGRVVAYEVRTPVRGQALRESVVLASESAELFEWLALLSAATGDLELDPGSAPVDGLMRLGVLLPEEEVSQAVNLSIDLRRVPWALCPRGGPTEVVGSADQGWIVTESLVAQDDDTPPPSIAARLPEVLPFPLRRGPIAWVEDARTHAIVPYGLDAATLSALRPAAPAPDLEPDVHAALARAGILVRPSPSEAPPHGVDDEDARSAAELRATGMTRLQGWLPPAHHALLRDYYRRRLDEGFVRLRSEGAEVRHVQHNEPMALFWLHQLTRAMSAVVGAPVKPSYVYFSSYVPGAELPWHVDREQCEYSVSLLIDYAPTYDDCSPWPLQLEGRDGQIVSVYQRLGEALVYRGRELRHGRSPLAPGHRSIHLFLHYVDESFAGPLA